MDKFDRGDFPRFSKELYVLINGPDALGLGLSMAGEPLEAALMRLQWVEETQGGGHYAFTGDPIKVWLGNFHCHNFVGEDFPIMMSCTALDGSDNATINGLGLLGAGLSFVYNVKREIGILENISQQRGFSWPHEFDDDGDNNPYQDFLKSLGLDVPESETCEPAEQSAPDGGSEGS